MKSYKFYVEMGEYVGGNGAFIGSTSKQFEVVVQAHDSHTAERMVKGQYGWPERCRVSYRGEA